MKKDTNLLKLIQNIENLLKQEKAVKTKAWHRLVRKYRKDDGSIASKNYILEYIKREKIKVSPEVLEVIRMKPTRTISGVTPITIFTKPYKCSGKCIFCPTSSKTPKSYLLEEPGIQRAFSLNYDPYKQIKLRIKALESIGHNTEKIELIISGGTWDDYGLDYRIWFVSEVYRALNGVKSQKYPCGDTLLNIPKMQVVNSNATYRNIGTCIETRPDKINVETLKLYRIFGITKVQLGIQSLNAKILEANCRGHSPKETFQAIDLLRLLGVKIQIHWMCNLYKSNLKLDYEDFKNVFSNKHVKPDEIKIYPCSIVQGIQLYEFFKKGLYKPYSTEELTKLLIKCKVEIPRYCRINRLFRDIPSNLILEGNKVTNLRQKIQEQMRKNGQKCLCIRCREVKDKDIDTLKLRTTKYITNVSTEYFLEYVTENDEVAAFLRLSIYKNQNSLLIETKAMIRELHVYGSSLKLKSHSGKSSQHTGLGTKLLLEAEEIAKKMNLDKIAIISGVGTRNYYKKRGYVIEKKYGYALKNL